MSQKVLLLTSLVAASAVLLSGAMTSGAVVLPTLTPVVTTIKYREMWSATSTTVPGNVSGSVYIKANAYTPATPAAGYSLTAAGSVALVGAASGTVAASATNGGPILFDWSNPGVAGPLTGTINLVDTSNSKDTAGKTITVTGAVVQNRVITASLVTFNTTSTTLPKRIMENITTALTGTTKLTTTGDDNHFTEVTVLPGGTNLTANGTVDPNGVSIAAGAATKFNAATTTVTRTLNVSATPTTTGIFTNASNPLILNVTGEGLAGESDAPVPVAYSYDSVANRTLQATTVNLGRIILGKAAAGLDNATYSGGTIVTSPNEDYQDYTAVTVPATLAAVTTSETNGINLSLKTATGKPYQFGVTDQNYSIALTATGATTTGTGAKATPTGNIVGSQVYTITKEGVTGEVVNNLTVDYSADVIQNRTITAAPINFGRYMAGSVAGDTVVTTLTSPGDNAHYTDLSLLTTTVPVGLSTATSSDANGVSNSVTNVNAVFDGTSSTQNWGLTLSRTMPVATGVKSAAINIKSTGEGLTGETDQVVSIPYSYDVLNNRTFTATTVAFGRVMAGQSYSGGTTTSITSTQTDITATEITLPATVTATGADGSAFSLATTSGSSYLFASSTAKTSAALTAIFETPGTLTTTATTTGAKFKGTGEGLTGESDNTVNVPVSATVLVPRSLAVGASAADTTGTTAKNLGNLLRGAVIPSTTTYIVSNNKSTENVVADSSHVTSVNVGGAGSVLGGVSIGALGTTATKVASTAAVTVTMSGTAKAPTASGFGTYTGTLPVATAEAKSVNDNTNYGNLSLFTVDVGVGSVGTTDPTVSAGAPMGTYTTGAPLTAAVASGKKMANSVATSTTPVSSLSTIVNSQGNLQADGTLKNIDGICGSELDILDSDAMPANVNVSVAWRARNLVEQGQMAGNGYLPTGATSIKWLTSDVADLSISSTTVTKLATPVAYAVQMSFNQAINSALDSGASADAEFKNGSLYLASRSTNGDWENATMGLSVGTNAPLNQVPISTVTTTTTTAKAGKNGTTTTWAYPATGQAVETTVVVNGTSVVTTTSTYSVAGQEMSYTNFLGLHPGASLDSLIGSWGVDTTNDEAWAIVGIAKGNAGANQTLEFAVVPEPSTLALLAAGAMGLLVFVRRRKS